MSQSRSTKEVFDDHLALRAAGQVDLDIERNYAHDVALITLDGIFAVTTVFENALVFSGTA
jgi:hypothetical protein